MISIETFSMSFSLDHEKLWFLNTNLIVEVNITNSKTFIIITLYIDKEDNEKLNDSQQNLDIIQSNIDLFVIYAYLKLHINSLFLL